MHTFLLRFLVLACSWTSLLAGVPSAVAGPIMLQVDASDAPRQILHARLSLDVQPGPLTLRYPKWIPGEHAPSGPISDLVNLVITAGGKTLPWRREAEDMFSFVVNVPQDVQQLEVRLDYLLPRNADGFSGAASSTARLVDISWNQVLLYPKGVRSADQQVKASLRLPQGWRYATALAGVSESQGLVEFEPVSLETLIDSPVIAGEYFRRVDLSPGDSIAHRLNMVADSPAALEISTNDVTSLSRLVKEARLLFGARHYRHYDFLLTLSDHVAHFGLEHHESSDNRVPERYLIDPDLRKWFGELLPHELVHSWNGKFLRPEGLVTSDFHEPMHSELLWVYEGLTDYLGKVLTARSGLWDEADFREAFAVEAAELDHRTGRAWRPLVDTAVAAQITYGARTEGLSRRRSVDFYQEGDLIWLEVDVLIRQLSEGRKSIEDFCRLFFREEDSPPRVNAYRHEDVLTALSAVASHDWKGFFDARVYATNPRAPLGGIEGSGWRLAYTNRLSKQQQTTEEQDKVTDVTFSLGLKIRENGDIVDVIADSPADAAGIGVGMKLVAANGRRWTPVLLREAIATAQVTRVPIALLMENADYFKTCELAYTGGERYPCLVRDETRPDLLTQILGPLEGKKAPVETGTAAGGPDKDQGSRSAVASDAEDPYLWLEDVTAEKALAWVKEQNASSTKELEGSPLFQPVRERLISILDSRERIPFVRKHGQWFYNFWRDEKNVRGIWRRTSLEEYRKADPQWEVVLDLDALAAAEKENWVWKGADVLEPDDDLCMVNLSRGGADATVAREFDLTRKEFVSAGFHLPEAKSSVSWKNRNTLYVGTDFGPGSLTSSGYPRVIREWKRGTPLAESSVVFEGRTEDVAAWVTVEHDHGFVYEFAGRAPTFFTTEMMVRRGETWVPIEKPSDAEVSTFGSYLLLRLRSPWNVAGELHPAGSLLAADFELYLQGRRVLTRLFEPGPRRSLDSITSTRNYLVLTELDRVRSRPHLLRHVEGGWEKKALDTPDFGTVGVSAVDADESDAYFMTLTDYLTPSSLFLGTAGEPGRSKLKGLPSFFKTDDLEIQQFEAPSRDGTLVPYFQVSRKGMALDGSHPTLLYGYGGFEVSELPSYRASVGATWLERGGVYVVANIRGGGEFGPDWHNAARKANRQKAFDDFAAVAEHLIQRKVTSPKHLGIMGGSNGGLLMGVMLTQRPELFGAIVCQVPLLDMRRYNKLLAGASWMDEYGDPDKTEEWAFISKYSPYQNVRSDRKYPRVLFTTSTRDDRVHPGHARKMVARMKEQGHDVLYYENIEGGHGGAANNAQVAYMNALAYVFLWNQLR